MRRKIGEGGWTMRFSAFLLVAIFVTTWMGKAGQPADKADKILKRFVEEFVLLTPGQDKYPASFMMGSKSGPEAEQPVHKVTLAYPFATAKYEVTQELYEVIAGKNPSKWKGPRNSVEMVSWDEANTFCRKVTAELHKRKLLAKDQVIRLPSEAEWEYACRAGTTGKYSFGDKEADLGIYCWFTGNAKGNDPPVGAKKPNPWGFYDMHGYVWEWCADTWHADYKNAPTDGSAWVDAKVKERVLRGGAWTEVADKCRSAYRFFAVPETRTPAIGFRCVQVKKGSGNER